MSMSAFRHQVKSNNKSCSHTTETQHRGHIHVEVSTEVRLKIYVYRICLKSNIGDLTVK